jgi:hypothetical protein
MRVFTPPPSSLSCGSSISSSIDRSKDELRRLLELDGFACTPRAILQGVQVPLLVSKDGARIAVGIQWGLLESEWNGHSLHGLASTRKPKAKILNEYILRRNLPDEHQLVREMF